MGIPKYKVPLRKVRLPPLPKIRTYFEKIDENLIYSNNGPLVRQLQECLADKYQLDVGLITITSSGTKSLQTILQQIINGQIGNKASLNRSSDDFYCILPSFTFAASAMAIIGAGLKPIFVDIEEKLGQLDPIAVEHFLDKEIVHRSKVIAVMPVSPFGAKIDKANWAKFTQKHAIELVYDEAWCFDSFTADSKGNSALSLHATKSFGCGEGGVIISNSPKRSLEYQSIINFGFGNTRESRFIGTNGKMSEYTAAVALALLDNWSNNRNVCLRVQDYYLEKIKSFSNIKVMQGFDTSWAWGALPIIFRKEQNLEQVIRAAEVQGIELRSWWKRGIHRFPAMKKFLRDDLKNTSKLTKKLINVPFFPEMKEEDVDLVCQFLKKFDI